MATQKPIVIANPQKGISPSPFVPGFSDIRNLDVQTRPGVARLNYLLQSVNPNTTIIVASATSNGTTSVTVNKNFVASGPKVTVSNSSGGAGVPANGAVYYIYYVNATTVGLATTYANALAGIVTTPSAGTFTLSTSNLMATPKHIVYADVNQTYYLQDSNGQVWSSTNLTSWTWLPGNSIGNYSGSLNATGNGLIVFKNYLLSFTDQYIEVYGPLNTGPAWITGLGGTNGTWWMEVTGNSAYDHAPYYSPINDTVYWSEFNPTNNYQGITGLGSLIQVVGQTFNPSTGWTSVTAQSTTCTLESSANSLGAALSLPAFYIPLCLKLVGDFLYIGTPKNIILQWDTHSATYNAATYLPEENVTSMENLGNFLYFACGFRGNIYFFNGYYAEKVAQVPVYLSNFPIAAIQITSLVKNNEKLFFLVQNGNCGGIWSFNPTSGYNETSVVVLENAVSSGTYNINAGVIFPIPNQTEQFIAGWIDGSSNVGLDAIVTANHTLTGYLETELMTLGTPNEPRRLNNYNIILADALTTGQSIQVYSRDSLSASYSLQATFDYTTYGATQPTFIKLPCGKDAINRQFKIVLNTQTGQTTPEFQSIYID